MFSYQNKKHLSSENINALYLDASHPVFKELSDYAKDAILVTYNGMVHCYVNHSACELTGYNFEELMSLGFKDLIHPDELCNIEDQLAKRKKEVGQPNCYKTRIVTKNGNIIPVEATFILDEKEDNGLSLAILRDIPKKNKIENELDKESDKINQEIVKYRSEWEILNRELVQTHQAMSVLAKNIDNRKVEIEKKVNTTIISKVMPIIKKLLTEEKIKRFWPEINLLAEHLYSITTKGELYRKNISLLSETEMKIAAMVKNGMVTKEIASVMFISVETVKAHRKNIRRKLKIQNTNHKLSEYLAEVIG